MRWWMVAAVAVLAAGCARLGLRPAGDGALERLPVLLAFDGDPLSTRDAARVAKALAAQIHRPVHTTHGTGIDRVALADRLRAS